MAYCTEHDLLDHYTEAELKALVDETLMKEGTSYQPGKVVTDAAIAAAGATIDAYCGGRYSLPLKQTEKVRRLCIDLAAYELEKRRRLIRESTLAQRDAALAYLRNVALGREVLPLSVDASEAMKGRPWRRFWLNRRDDKTGVSRTGRVLEGAVLTSGRVVVEWRAPYNSIAIYQSLAEFSVVHVDCHPSSNEIVWVDKEDA